MAAYLLGYSIVLFLCTFALHRCLRFIAWRYELSDPPTRPTIAFSLSILLAFVPITFFQLAQYYKFSTLPLMNTFPAFALAIGLTLALLELVSLIGRAIVSSVVIEQIDKHHLPSQLPWALVSALAQKLYTILITITDGNWGALEQRPLPTLPEVPFWKSLLKIGRQIVIAVVPLALFLLAEPHLGNADDLKASLLYLAIGWTGVSLLTLLDPNFAAKLSSFKDVKELFGTKKER